MQKDIFSEIAPYELEGENFFNDIGKEWMLVSAKSSADGRANMMTASWGGIGVLWGRPVCMCVIRPQRFTYGIIEESDRICLNFMGEDFREQLNYCGKASGRDADKISECGFDRIDDGGAVYFAQSRMVIVGKKLYYSDIEPDGFIARDIIDRYYPARDFHRMYVCEIEKILKKV